LRPGDGSDRRSKRDPGAGRRMGAFGPSGPGLMFDMVKRV